MVATGFGVGYAVDLLVPLTLVGIAAGRIVVAIILAREPGYAGEIA